MPPGQYHLLAGTVRDLSSLSQTDTSAGMYGMAVAYCMAYTALTLGAALLGFSMPCGC